MPRIFISTDDPLAMVMLDNLREIGHRRDQCRTGRDLTAATKRASIAKEIKHAHKKARDIGLSKLDIANALGITRAQLHNILNNNPGGVQRAPYVGAGRR